MPSDPNNPPHANPEARTLDGDTGDLFAGEEAAPTPSLRIFDPERGARTVLLEAGESVIGRGQDADVFLDDPYVSRRHAVVRRGKGGAVLEDAGSTTGTLVNNRRVEKHALEHGDTIQIRDFVLQYLDGRPSEDAAAEEPLSPAQKAFREQYNRLPDRMRVRFRRIKVDPADVFAPGDTIVVGEGGVLLAAPEIPAETDYILEVEVGWPDGQKRVFFGELMGKLPRNLMCVKLHARKPDGRYAFYETAMRSSWTDAAPRPASGD